MKKFFIGAFVFGGLLFLSPAVSAQYRTDGSSAGQEASVADSLSAPVQITLEQALEIALSENLTVKIADKEIERTGFAKKGTYASLFPQIDLSGAYQRTIKKQVMYMDFDMGSLGGMAGGGSSQEGEASAASAGEGLEVGRWNTWSAGLTANMPLVNLQLWKSIKLSGMDVELAVEKARSSRLEMVTQVKSAYYATLLAKESLRVFKDVYDNAVENYEETLKKYNAQKASELDLTRAKTTVANAVPNVYNAESSVVLSLWQLKAVMGIGLDEEIDVVGVLGDHADQMFSLNPSEDSLSLENNTTLRQLAIQAEQLAETVKLQKYAYVPTLSAGFSYSLNAMTNDFDFKEYKWTPYSYVGITLAIPIFSGGKRYNDVRQAKNTLQQVQMQATDAERNLKIGIRQSLTTMETNVRTYFAAKEAVTTARKAYEIAERSYQVGKSTLTDLNDARLALTQASLSESQAIYNYVVAKAQLEQTLGRDFINE